MRQSVASLAALVLMLLSATTSFAEIRKVSIKTIGMD
jgi:hypothetical protein